MGVQTSKASRVELQVVKANKESTALSKKWWRLLTKMINSWVVKDNLNTTKYLAMFRESCMMSRGRHILSGALIANARSLLREKGTSDAKLATRSTLSMRQESLIPLLQGSTTLLRPYTCNWLASKEIQLLAQKVATSETYARCKMLQLSNWES